MDDAAGVGGAERGRDAAGDGERLGLEERAARVHAARQALALEELHHDERAAVGLVAEVEHLDDAGVLDRGRGLGLVEEPVHDAAILGVLRVQDLHGGGATDERVLGAIDRAHAAAPDDADDPVAPEQRPDHPRRS